MRFRLVLLPSLCVLLASCANQISLPVSVKTSRGELFTGTTIGPPFNGQVRLQSASGTTCSGAYTTDEYRTIRAPSVTCSDGRSASFRAKLEADLTSARGTARFSDGTTGDVGVGARATAVESGVASPPSASARTSARSSTSAQRRAEQVIERRLKTEIQFPTSVEFLTNRKDGNAGSICGYVFVTHPDGNDVTIRRLFTSIVFYPETGEPMIAGGFNLQKEGVTLEDFAGFCKR